MTFRPSNERGWPDGLSCRTDSHTKPASPSILLNCKHSEFG